MCGRFVARLGNGGGKASQSILRDFRRHWRRDLTGDLNADKLGTVRNDQQFNAGEKMAYRVDSEFAGRKTFETGAQAFQFAKYVAREEGGKVDIVEASSLVDNLVGTVRFVGPRAEDFNVWSRIQGEWLF